VLAAERALTGAQLDLGGIEAGLKLDPQIPAMATSLVFHRPFH
jgi:hypothetical protein